MNKSDISLEHKELDLAEDWTEEDLYEALVEWNLEAERMMEEYEEELLY